MRMQEYLSTSAINAMLSKDREWELHLDEIYCDYKKIR